MDKRIAFISVMILTISMSCTSQKREIRSQDLIGHYSSNMNPKGDSIFVNENGTYKHLYFKNGSLLHSTTGTWRYDSVAGYIFFDNFTDFIDDGPIEPHGTWGPEVVISPDGKEIQLIYSDENQIHYSKLVSQ